MLATIDDGGIYHDAHVITKIARANAPSIPIKITSYPVFSADSQENAEMASQVQYAMSEDTASYGTAPNAAMSNGQEIIAKTGTTNKAQSAFFIGATPSQSLAVALFSDNRVHHQGDTERSRRAEEGGYGGTWPATIWHTYAENEFVPLGVQTYTTPVFTGQTWNLVPPNLRVVPKKKKASNKNNQHNQWWDQGNGNNGNNNGGNNNGGDNNGGNGTAEWQWQRWQRQRRQRPERRCHPGGCGRWRHRIGLPATCCGCAAAGASG